MKVRKTYEFDNDLELDGFININKEHIIKVHDEGSPNGSFQNYKINTEDYKNYTSPD